MKRVLSALAWVVGGLALVVGAVVASLVGPDDVVDLAPKPMDSSVHLVVTQPGLLAYSDTAVRVTAEASAGEVFVGAAHPVDVASYTGDAPVFEVRGVEANGTVRGSVAGKPEATSPNGPSALDIWSLQAVGSGPQVLDVPLDGAPLQVVVQSRRDATITLGLGARIEGLFAVAVGVAVGGLLVVAALAARRVGARRDRSGRAQAGAGAGESSSAFDAPSESGESGESGEPIEAGVARRVRMAPALAVGAAFSLSGCLALPAAVPAPAGPPTKIGLTSEQAATVLADYDRRNNAALGGMVKELDPKAWALVDSGPVLAADRYATVRAEVMGPKPEMTSATHRAGHVYSPDFAAYPLWAMMTASVTATSSGKDSTPVERLAVFQRTSAHGPWTKHLSVPVEVETSTPSPVPSGEPATARAEDVEAGVAAMKQVIAFYETGKTTWQPTPNMKKQRESLTSSDGIAASVKVTCLPYLVGERAERSMRVVRTDGGALAVMTLRCTMTAEAQSGEDLTWTPEFARVLGLPSTRGRYLTRPLLVTVAGQVRGASFTPLGADMAGVRLADLSPE